jgi:methionyl-tRNA formyltransferase
MNICLLISGGLGLHSLKHLLKSKHTIISVFTDRKSNDIIELSSEKSISCFVGNPRDGKGSGFLKVEKIDLLLTVNYLFIIERDMYSKAKIACNIHGSLLPKYRGRTPHVWAIINNEKQAGVTAHLIDDGCDTGDIVSQMVVPIEENDTGASLLAKYNIVYISIINDLLAKFDCGKWSVKTQEHGKATYFGKRTPDDGEIIWDWQKERIRNWVRAQTDPYPGAFSWYEGKKITIDWVEYDDFGFNDEMVNGLLLTTEPLRVKTPNGVLRITSIRQKELTFKDGKILGSI